jgi:RNA polymerase sigma-70 factor, ECF subfamily
VSNASQSGFDVPSLIRLETGKEALSLEEEVLCLHDHLRPRLIRYAASLGLKCHDAEDIVQEVFLALFRHLQSERSRSNLLGWLFRVTHNLALKRRVLYSLEDQAKAMEEIYSTVDPGPEEGILFGERHFKLRRAFEALPETDRLCLQLRSEGLKYREIARILGISLGGVANSLGRSLDRLQRSEGEG